MSKEREGRSYDKYGRDFAAAREAMIGSLKSARKDIMSALVSLAKEVDGLKVCARGGGGRGGLKLYRWVNLKYDSGGTKRSYMIALSRQDIDIGTGNLHERFGEIQFIRSSGETISTTYGHVVARKAEDSKCTLVYRVQDAYPRVAEVGSGKPWGLDIEWEGAEPSLNIADESFDAEKAAKYFVALVEADIEQRP